MSPNEPKEEQDPRKGRDLPDYVEEIEAIAADDDLLENPAGPSSQSSGSVGDDPILVWERRRFAHLKGITCTVTAELDYGALIQTILARMIRAARAERGILFLGRSDPPGLVPVLAENIEGQELRQVERVSRTILTEGARGRTVFTADALEDPRFKDVASVRVNRMRSVLCLPLTHPSGQVGALYLDSSSARAFPDGTLALLRDLAEVAASALRNARIHADLATENRRLREIRAEGPWSRLAGRSAAMEAIRGQAATAAALDQPTLILGEPGTGRSLLAQVIHERSRRANGPFVSCDLSVHARKLQRGLLFGRARAGAQGSRPRSEPGLLDQVDRGVLYLANAERLGEDSGKDLARALLEGRFRPVGSQREQRVDLRVILSVTLRPGEGPDAARIPRALDPLFPEPRLLVPPLRERAEDVPLLMDRIVRQFRRADASHQVFFDSDAIAVLRDHPWPGNVRQLEHVLHRLMLGDRNRPIEAAEVRDALDASGGGGDLPAGRRGVRTLRDVEAEEIRRALRETKGNKSETARLLGIHRNTLLTKLKRMGMHPDG
ncbi:MAG: GAF domain-containing protein [Candidatus Eisenbacteria bacterium]|nr:GAF domain-containing protein [Candidatus Latescibacterota bacterium]MBD3300830.1 GAF domain-containing protein [Candidatus Eisenbacteria bacterium]